MGEMTDKAKAAGNKLAGNVKEGIGKMTDNERLQAELAERNGTGTSENERPGADEEPRPGDKPLP